MRNIDIELSYYMEVLLKFLYKSASFLSICFNAFSRQNVDISLYSSASSHTSFSATF